MQASEMSLLQRMKHRYLLIPVELCAFCLEERFITGLQIYILLKAISPGRLPIDRNLKLQIRDLLSVTERTVNYNLQRLLDQNWIGYNPATKIYYIRSFKTVSTIEEFTSRVAANFKVADIHLQKSELHKMKAFAAGAVVGYCAYLNKVKKKGVVPDGAI